MASKTISAAKQAAAGFTLTEVLITIGLVGLIGTALVAFSIFSARTVLAASNRLSLEAGARAALDRLTYEMRNSLKVTGYTTNSISFQSTDLQTVTFVFDPAARQLKRIRGAETTVLLSDCDAAIFSMFGPVPQSGTFDLVPVTDPNFCKAVNVQLNCSRVFVRPQIHALNTITATVVLRMK